MAQPNPAGFDATRAAPAARDAAAPFSILFPGSGTYDEHAPQPTCFADLHLDQLVDALAADRDEYDIRVFFNLPLHDARDVAWRQDVVRDLETPAVLAAVEAFAAQMRLMRLRLARAGAPPRDLSQQRWFLDAATTYRDAVSALRAALDGLDLASDGFARLREYLVASVATAAFTTLTADVDRVRAALDAIRYELVIHDLAVQVRRYAGEADYGAVVDETFARFREGGARDYAFSLRHRDDGTHVDARILTGVAHLFPGPFRDLAEFCAAHEPFADPTLTRFDREVQVYLAMLAYVAPLRAAGLAFCLPSVVSGAKRVRSERSFDLVLAHKLVADGRTVVCNDFHLDGPERILVVSGPNQGGKTTFARAFGQLHYLASLGLPVPGARAELPPCAEVFTHFEREEQAQALRGKLEDELLRIREILERATPQSCLVLNEIFTSTTLHDAVLLSRRVAAHVVALDVPCVWVTFVDEVAALGPQTVSMVATVVPDRPSERTYRVVRARADGLAHALSLAEQYGLTYARILARLGGAT